MNNLSNRVVLIGNLGNDPQVRQFENGNAIARFSVATTEFIKGKDGDSESKTTWHKVVVWNGKAKYAEKYLRKGNKVALEVKLDNRSWEDKDKNRHYITEVVANEVISFSWNDLEENDK